MLSAVSHVLEGDTTADIQREVMNTTIPPSTAFLACPQYNHLLFNAEYVGIMPVSLNIS